MFYFSNLRLKYTFLKSLYVGKLLHNYQHNFCFLNKMLFFFNFNKLSFANLFWVIINLFDQIPCYVVNKSSTDKGFLLLSKCKIITSFFFFKLINYGLLFYLSKVLLRILNSVKNSPIILVFTNNIIFQEVYNFCFVIIKNFVLRVINFFNNRVTSAFEKNTVLRFMQFPVQILNS